LVSTLVIVTVTPGSTPPELSETVPSMAPFAACDCASAGAVKDSDSSAERKYLSIPASIQTIGEPASWRVGESAMKSEDFVGRIHFPEVMAQQDPACEIRAGDSVACIAKREQMMREVAVRANAW